MNKEKFFCKIKVTNLYTKAVYFHNKVPYEHVEMLKLSPNLEVDILGHHREDAHENREALEQDCNSIII
jgi:hypothetical protein